MWTDLRKDIEQVRKDLNIPDSCFHAIPTDQWQEIEKNIYHNFVEPGHVPGDSIGLWESFKMDTHSLQFMYNYPFDQFLKFVDPAETVWLFLNETVRERTKFWFYEGKVNEIVTVLSESIYIDEVYIASKKYEWLLCINHHDYLIATGNIMPDRLRQSENDGHFKNVAN